MAFQFGGLLGMGCVEGRGWASMERCALLTSGLHVWNALALDRGDGDRSPNRCWAWGGNDGAFGGCGSAVVTPGAACASGLWAYGLASAVAI